MQGSFIIGLCCRKYNGHLQHDDRNDDVEGGGGYNRVWNRLGPRQVRFGDDGIKRNDGPRRGSIKKNNSRGKYNNKPTHVEAILDEHNEGEFFLVLLWGDMAMWEVCSPGTWW